MRILNDLWAILKGAGIQLDEAEAAALGGPKGETISYWMAMESRHGVVLAHLACLALYLVQYRHCHDQIVGVPMQPVNYLKAIALLILFAPFAFSIGAIRAAVRAI